MYLDALSRKTWKDASPICDLEQTDASDSVAGPTPTFKREDDALGKSSIAMCETVGFTC